MSELTLDGLKDMKKADFIKAFKNKAAWKKAKAVLILVDYKLEGKKTTVAIPFNKEAEMKAELRKVKYEKIHPMKKTGGGDVSFENDGPDGMKAKIELTRGGLKPEMLQTKGEELFGRINAVLEVKVSKDKEDQDRLKKDGETEEDEADFLDDTDVTDNKNLTNLDKEGEVTDKQVHKILDTNDGWILLKAHNAIQRDIDKLKTAKTAEEQKAIRKGLAVSIHNWLKSYEKASAEEQKQMKTAYEKYSQMLKKDESDKAQTSKTVQTPNEEDKSGKSSKDNNGLSPSQAMFFKDLEAYLIKAVQIMNAELKKNSSKYFDRDVQLIKESRASALTNQAIENFKKKPDSITVDRILKVLPKVLKLWNEQFEIDLTKIAKTYAGSQPDMALLSN
jgi:hypothetical protein